jgi:hypothetical protein
VGEAIVDGRIYVVLELVERRLRANPNYQQGRAASHA